MKKILLLAAIAMINIAAFAQWTFPVPTSTEKLKVTTEGDTTFYYLYNKDAQAYCTAGNAWGKQASIGSPALKCFFTQNADGSYLIWDWIPNNWKSDNYQWLLLFFENETEMYVDRRDQSNYFWNIIDVGNQTYRFRGADANPDFNPTNYPNCYMGFDQYVGASLTGPLSPELNIKDVKSGHQYCVDWQLVSPTVYDALENKLAPFYAAKALESALEEAKNFSVINVAGFQVVYNNTSSTEEELVTSRWALEAAIELVQYLRIVEVEWPGVDVETAYALLKSGTFSKADVEQVKFNVYKTIQSVLLANASEKNPIDATSLIENASFDYGNSDGWELTFGNYNYDAGVHDYTLPDGTPIHGHYNEATGAWIQGFIEAWTPTPGPLENGIISQTVKSLPAGIYKVACDAIACNQDMDKQESVGVYLFAECGGIITSQKPISTANEKPEHFELLFVCYGGDVKIGLMSQDAIANWMAADNFELWYYGMESLFPDLDNASADNPIDLSKMIINSTFDTDISSWYYSGATPTFGGKSESAPNAIGDRATLSSGNVEVWHDTFNMFQTVYNLPKGLYKLTCQAFERSDEYDAKWQGDYLISPKEGIHAVLYANKQENKVNNIMAFAQDNQVFEYGGESEEDWMSDRYVLSTEQWVPNSMEGTNFFFNLSPETYLVSVECMLEDDDDNITIGIKNDYNNSWVIFDNFCLYYMGQTCATPQISYDDMNNRVIMTCATNGVTIYYTIDGTTPTENSSRYTGPITILNNCTIKAIAVKNGFTNSIVATKSIQKWRSVIANGDCEGTDLSNYSARDYVDGELLWSPSVRVIEDPKDMANHCIVVTSNLNPENNWDTQFFIRANEFILPGAKLRFSIRVRADKEQIMNIEFHGAPGAYHWNETDRQVLTEWTTISGTYFINDTMSPDSDPMQTIAIKLSYLEEGNTIYFDDIVLMYEDSGVEKICAIPIFSYDNLQLTINTATEDATIYYTTNGSTPTTSSTMYSGPISLTADCTVKAITVKEGYTDSEVATYQFSLNEVKCQTPQLQRDGVSNRIIMTCATAGASIYYTRNGTTPTKNSLRYSAPIYVAHNCTIQAIAIRDDLISSSVSQFLVDWFKVATPTFNYDNLQLTISTTTSGATIYYTTDGSTPTTSSTMYTGPLSLTKNTTVKAIAVKEDFNNSDVGTYNFVKDDQTCQTPQISRDGTSNRVVITCATSGASIYYTIDGSAPSPISSRYSGPITVEHNLTIRAIATKDGMYTSAISESFKVDWFKVATPTFSYSNLQLTISTTTSDARIYYTIDGSDPLKNLTKAIRYTSPIKLEADVEVKAVGIRTNYSNSAVSTYTFVKSDYTCKQPQIQRDGSTDRLTMSCATSNAILYYTTDGSIPTTSSTRYTGPVTVAYNCTVRAIATRNDLFPSDVSEFKVDWLSVSDATLAYSNGVLTISYAVQGAEIHYEIGGKDATKSSPLYTGPITLTDNREVRYVVYATGQDPISGSFTPTDFACKGVTMSYDGLNIELSTAEEGATIYYTIDGSLPTTSSAVYTGKTPLPELCTVNAIAVKKDKNNSELMQQPVTYFFDGSTISVSEPGRLKDATKWSGTDNILSLTILCQEQGFVNATDMAFLRTIKGLKHLDMKEVRFADNTVPNGAFAGMNIITVEFPTSNILTIQNNVFSGCKHLAAIIWNARVLMASTAQVVGISNPNLLLYVDNKVYAPQGVRNVIANGSAGNIVLTDENGGSYYCPQAFQAQSISYTHTYSQTTGINKECRGWETIALPFDVQNIIHESAGNITPFASNDATARSFWLAELGSTGFKRASKIKAYTPYIISMPNNEVYGSSYILAGRVTFEAVNATVPETNIMTTSKGDHVFTPCFDAVEASSTVFAINKNDGNTNFVEGSVFMPSYREVKPFEAYIAVPTNGVAPRYIPIRDDDTGIENLTPSISQGEEATYDLTGRKLNEVPTVKGVYIVNGKKTLVK